MTTWQEKSDLTRRLNDAMNRSATSKDGQRAANVVVKLLDEKDAEIERLKAELAEQTARAERAIKALAYAADRRGFQFDFDAWLPMVVEALGREPALLPHQANPRAERAEAACAEMRAAAVGVDGRCRLCTASPREHRDNCALSRPDLGRGWASPEDTAQMVGALQMVEGDGEFDSLHEVTRKFVVDVLALLGKAGG